MKNGAALVKEDPTRVERGFLVGVYSKAEELNVVRELLQELGELTDTLGLETVGSELVRIREPNPRLLIGKGKAEEIARLAEEAGADVIIFDEFLSPSQQRNWEEMSNLAVIDRQEVILDIFASNARTSEATLQVQLAKANYDLPRLKRRWTHLHRQAGTTGGMGARGEGEQQLELDSRAVRRNIAKLQRQLDDVRQHREVQRARRMRKPFPVAAIVGYTNAGKSSLLNALTDAGVLVEDKLFATLDPTVRRLKLPGGQDILLTDTVGFIRKLPHTLIEAFKSTLEETVIADFIIEVADASTPGLDDRHDTTMDVLKQIGVAEKPTLMVLNKMDLVDDPVEVNRLRGRYPDSVFVSARRGDGLDDLARLMAGMLDAESREYSLFIPHSRHDIVSKVRLGCSIIDERHEADGVYLVVMAPRSQWSFVESWRRTEVV